MSDCPLCLSDGGELIAAGRRWRVVRVDDAAFPAYYRVVSMRHVAEFSDMARDERAACMEVVACVERLLVEHLQPSKVNLASLGNMVPHLHWHVIARFAWDSHFPAPVWGEARREVDAAAVAGLELPLARVDEALRAVLPPMLD